MNKIEKLELNINHLELNQITKKLNEIIDVLNQKQPEGVEYEKRVRILGELSGSKPEETEHMKLHKEVFYGIKPENQEEWRMEVRKGEKYCEVEIGNVGTTGLFENLYEALPFIFKMLKEIYKGDLDKYLDQLLSERTEEVLNEIKDMKYKGDTSKYKHIKTTYDCKTVDEYIWFVGGMTLNNVIEKISKLLELKEEE